MNVAVLGAGKAAEVYIEQYAERDADTFECFTSDGQGHLFDIAVNKLSLLNTSKYDKVVVCSQFIDAIVGTLQDNQQTLNNVYIFSYKTHTEHKLDTSSLTFKTGNTLYAYYRLSCMSLAFNYACFVNSAQVYANQHNYQKIVFIVSSGRFNHVNYGGSLAYSKEQQFWRLSNLLPMISQLANGYCSFLHFDDEKESNAYLQGKSQEHIFPDNAVQKGYFTKLVEASYTIGPCMLKLHFDDVQALSPDKQAVDYIENNILNRLNGKKLVTITLRETSLYTSRNSGLSKWQQFSQYLLERGYQPLIIRDTSRALEFNEENLFPGAICLSAAAFNVHIRTALYSVAYFNIGTDCGAIALAFFMKDINFSFFFVDTDNSRRMMTIEIENAKRKGIVTGLGVGLNYPFLSGQQRVVWEEETYENIVNEFEDFTSQG